MGNRHWLETALRLDMRLNIYEDYARRIAELIYQRIYRDDWIKDREEPLIRLLANLRLGYELDKPLRYSRRNGAYKSSGVGKKLIVGLIDEMDKYGLLQQSKGYLNHEDQIRKQTRMWPGPLLIDLFESIHPQDIVKEPPIRLVQLKDRKTKGQMDYETSDKTECMIRELLDYGEMMHSHMIQLRLSDDALNEDSVTIVDRVLNHHLYTYFEPLDSSYKQMGFPCIDGSVLSLYSLSIPTPYHHTIHTPPPNLPPTPHTTTIPTITGNLILRLKYNWLHRVFNDSFELGGRFYGAAWQMLNEPLRNMLWIDSEPVTELDFSGQHVRMLYHLEGLQFDGDPYSFGKDEFRPLYKIASLVLINSQSNDPYRAVRKAFLDEGLSGRFEGCLSKEFIKSVIEDFFSAHEKISKHFFSDVGIRLQNIDAEITSDVIDHFIRQDIPILPIHDSYVVPARYRDELDWAMDHFYREKLHYVPMIH